MSALNILAALGAIVAYFVLCDIVMNCFKDTILTRFTPQLLKALVYDDGAIFKLLLLLSWIIWPVTFLPFAWYARRKDRIEAVTNKLLGNPKP